MGKNDRLSRDQKRKAKLKKRAERSRKHESLAYHGNQYKTPEWVPILHRTEVGVYESYVMSDRTLTDDQVESSFERLIRQLRANPHTPIEELDDDEEDNGLVDLTMWSIRRNWQILEDRDTLPVREDLIGVVRTLLHSLEIWRSKSMHGRGYLQFVEGFMKQTGVTVEMVDPDQLSNMMGQRSPFRALPHQAIEDEEED
jgi:hypothetical protein